MKKEDKKQALSNKQIFILRLCVFLIFAIVVPFCYITIKYDLFKPTTGVQFGFWGIFAFGLLCIVVASLIKYYLNAMKTKYSYLKQILKGTIQIVLPLTLVIIVCSYLRDNLDLVLEAIYVIMPCEIIAIAVNPLPKWCYDNNVDGIVEISEKVFRKKKEIDNEPSSSSDEG